MPECFVAKADELEDEPSVMGVVSLRQAAELVFGYVIAEHPPQVVEHHSASIGQQVVQQPVEWRLGRACQEQSRQ